MSSAPGETENGRANSVNDEEEEEEKNVSAGTQDGACESAQMAPPTYESEPNGDPEMSEDANNATDGSHQFSLSGRGKGQKSPVEPKGPGLLSVGLDGPSSADGSLSIPDDTPSVQVRTRMKIFSQ